MREFIDIVESATAAAFPIPATPENIAKAKAFLLRKWQERWREKNPNGPTYSAAFGWAKEPEDLSGSCKFSSMFAQRVFGGTIQGHRDHQFVQLPDGQVLDLNDDAEDVRGMAEPHRHDRRFFGNREHKESMASCEPRVRQWVEEFAREIGVTLTEAAEGEQPYINAHRSGDIVWIDMMHVPKGLRGRGAGRAFYERWEAALPKDVRLVKLMAADTGEGASNGFWEAMGFDYQYAGEDLGYEASQTMWKGVNGHATPPTVVVDEAED